METWSSAQIKVYTKAARVRENPISDMGRAKRANQFRVLSGADQSRLALFLRSVDMESVIVFPLQRLWLLILFLIGVSKISL